MNNVLERICHDKREHIARRKKERGESSLLNDAEAMNAPRGFVSALREMNNAGENALIAEIKRASPSRGLIREDFDVKMLAKAYQEGGAACLSVLTDAPYFQGDDRYIAIAKEAVSLPVLRKDFMLDPYQIIESRALDADCILLIMAALSNEQARELEQAALDLGMDILVEVHDAAEMERALTHLHSPLLGINNRNLKTLEVDLATTEKLSAMVPEEKLLVCESGIGSHRDILRMNDSYVHCFLVGESLMQQKDVASATRRLLGLPHP